MGKSIRSKGMRKNRALRRTGEYGDVESERLQRLVTSTPKKHSLSIFHSLLNPLETPVEIQELNEIPQENIEENHLIEIEENDLIELDQVVLSKKEKDVIHLSRNQFKIKYRKYGKGKSKGKK
jgi:hypothetical protein